MSRQKKGTHRHNMYLVKEMVVPSPKDLLIHWVVLEDV